MSQFLACLLLCSPVGGNLVFVYSTSLDRAQEVLRAAKVYIDWITTDPPKWAPKVQKVRDNERLVAVYNGESAVNYCVARPRGTAGCRGDAPHCAFVDEVAFVERDWWQRFFKPTMMNVNRRFTLITTPPPSGGFFATFVESIKNNENPMFVYVNHSLVCEKCAAAGIPDRCVHAMQYLPPWKSYFQLKAIQSMSSRKEKAALMEEIFGIVGREAEGYFPEHLISHHQSLSRLAPRYIDTIWFGLDPASHMRSSMGLSAISINSGVVTILGTASVKAGPANLEDCCKAVVAFVNAVVRHRETDAAKIIPVIECNASEITARQYLDAIREQFGQKVSIPFEKTTFKTCITDGIGVYTTKGNKQAAVLGLRRKFIDGTLRVWEKVETADSSAYNPTHIPIKVDDALETLYEQLSAVRDNEDGTISGKGDGGDDDAAQALLMALHWASAVMEAKPDTFGPQRFQSEETHLL